MISCVPGHLVSREAGGGIIMKLKVIFLIFSVVFIGALVSCDEDAGESEATPESEKKVEAEADDSTEAEEQPAVEEENNVLILTKSNFDDVIQERPIILVEFYAPWCGHCKALTPKYEAAAKILKTNDPPVALAKVDATQEEDLAQRYGVSGYPTLKFFKDGVAYDYEGPREEEGIVSYMKDRADSNWKPPPDAVITLTDANFREVVDNEALILVEFYAPWCGHCKQLAPEYEKAAKILAESDPPVKLAKVDATVETKVANQYGVSGYPSLKVFRFGKASEYKGGREQHSIVEYMEKQRGDGSKEITSAKDLQRYMAEDDVTVVGFFTDDKSPLYTAYMDFANDQRESYKLAHTFDADAAGQFKVKQGSVTVFYPARFSSKYEPKYKALTKADATSEELLAFIDSKDVPLVGQYSYTLKEKRYKSKRPLLLMFYTVDFSFDHRDATQLWRSKLLEIAKEHPDLTFAIADEDEMSEIFKEFGFDESGEEVNIGILGARDTKYPMPPMEDFDTDAIQDFITSYLKGNLKPIVKSQPVPKKNKGPVTVVVGKTFEKIVMDSKKDVLVEFYAPWCGHCKKFEPEYKKLAKKHKSEKNLVFAKMDATANDSPDEYKAEGFPTIYFAPANKKMQPVKYEGNRDEEDLIKFMKDNAAVSFGKSLTKDEL